MRKSNRITNAMVAASITFFLLTAGCNLIYNPPSFEVYFPPEILHRPPQWSPTGALVFTHENKIYIAESDGSSFQLIHGSDDKNSNSPGISNNDNYADSPSISPDGSQIVYVDYSYRGGGSDISRSMLDGSRRGRLDPACHVCMKPIWSPDGTRIAFMSGRSLLTVASDGSDSRLIFRGFWDSPSFDEISYLSFAWSPDGHRIAFVVLEVRKSSMRRVLYNAAADGSYEISFGHTGEVISSPAWSPDGRSIAFAQEDDDGVPDIYTISPDGSNLQRVFRFSVGDYPSASLDYSLSWSPDGSELLLSSGSSRPAVINLGESKLRRLPGPVGSASWSPDGSRIAISSRAHDRSVAPKLFTVARDGSDGRVLVMQDGEGNLTPGHGRSRGLTQ